MVGGPSRRHQAGVATTRLLGLSASCRVRVVSRIRRQRDSGAVVVLGRNGFGRSGRLFYPARIRSCPSAQKGAGNYSYRRRADHVADVVAADRNHGGSAYHRGCGGRPIVLSRRGGAAMGGPESSTSITVVLRAHDLSSAGFRRRPQYPPRSVSVITPFTGRPHSCRVVSAPIRYREEPEAAHRPSAGWRARRMSWSYDPLLVRMGPPARGLAGDLVDGHCAGARCSRRTFDGMKTT